MLRLQLEFAAKEGIATLIIPEPALAPTTVVPATHVVDRLGVSATTRPTGNVSANWSDVSDTPGFSFLIVNVKVEVAPAAIEAGANFLAIDGAENVSAPAAGAAAIAISATTATSDFIRPS